MVNGHKANEVDGELYAHKLDAPATIGNVPLITGKRTDGSPAIVVLLT